MDTVASAGVRRLHSRRMSPSHPGLGTMRADAAQTPSPSTARRAGQLIAIATVIVATVGGLLMWLLDGDEFPTLGSGLWFALQTVTTVGYGDNVPADTEGKVIAGLVMVTGIGFLSVVTASISAIFVESARRKRRDDDGVVERLERIEKALEELKEHR